MRFYFPDSQDQIDPTFDFETEERSPFRIRQRDDRYAHELLSPPPYAGMLVSKAMVDGVGSAAGRYSAQQRQRLYRVGIREFFRLTRRDQSTRSATAEPSPTYARKCLRTRLRTWSTSTRNCGFDAGISLDHVILGFDLEPPTRWRRR